MYTCSWYFSESDNLSLHQCATFGLEVSWCQIGSTHDLGSLLRRTPASRIQKSFAARKAGLEKHARKKINNYNECISAVKGYTSGTSKFACFCYSGVIKKKSPNGFSWPKNTHTQHAKTIIEPDWGWDHDTLVGAIKSLQSEAGPTNSELIGSSCTCVTGWQDELRISMPCHPRRFSSDDRSKWQQRRWNVKAGGHWVELSGSLDLENFLDFFDFITRIPGPDLTGEDYQLLYCIYYCISKKHASSWCRQDGSSPLRVRTTARMAALKSRYLWLKKMEEWKMRGA